MMKDVISAGYKDRTRLTFSWEIITTCQYRCDYCYAFELLEKKFDPALENIYKLTLLKLKQLKRKFDVELLGGEPSLHPNIDKIVTGLVENDMCNSVELVSNMVKPVKFYEQFNHDKYKKLTIAASYHPQYDKDFRYAKKCIDIDRLENVKLYCNVNLPKEDEQWIKIQSTVDMLMDNGVDVGLNFIHSVQGRYDSYYTDKFKTMFGKYIGGDKAVPAREFPYNMNGETKMLTEHEIKLNNLADFYGYKCTPLTYTIDIHSNIRNACSEKTITDMSSFGETITCPIKGGCNCDLLYTYYKQKQ